MLFGARRVGKTSLVEAFLEESDERWFRGQGEDRVLAELLGSRALERYRLAFSNVDGVFETADGRLFVSGYSRFRAVAQSP